MCEFLEHYLSVEFEKYKSNIISSKENSQKFLIDLGVNNKDGTLTENYK
jgi:c-di-GMP-binding flagellar brake protein YcgR